MLRAWVAHVPLKYVLLETWFRGPARCLVLGWPLYKGPVHRAITWDNSATTRLEWDGLGVIIRSFWFGVTYLQGKGGKLLWPSY